MAQVQDRIAVLVIEQSGQLGGGRRGRRSEDLTYERRDPLLDVDALARTEEYVALFGHVEKADDRISRQSFGLNDVDADDPIRFRMLNVPHHVVGRRDALAGAEK